MEQKENEPMPGAQALNPTAEGQPSVQARFFSRRDAVYEAILETPPSQSKAGGLGHKMNPAERELTLLVMEKQIVEELETLKAEATLQGDEVALRCLHSIAYESTRQLFLLAQYSPELVSKVAEHKSVWPVLYSKGIAAEEAAINLTELIGLGRKATGVLEPSNVLSERSETRIWIAVIAGLMDRIRHEARRVETQQELFKNATDPTIAIITALDETPGPGASDTEILGHLKGIALHPDEVARLNALLEVEDPFSNPDTLNKLILDSMQLPELSIEDSAIDRWLSVIKQFLLDVYNGQPQRSRLGRIGVSYADSKDGAASSIRVGMWRELRRALVSIAKAGLTP